MTLSSNKFSRVFVYLLILLIGAFFNTVALHHAGRWHPDEAFYMTIARNAAINGDWMLVSEPLDKPPLTYYTNALSLVAFAVRSDVNGVLFLDVHQGEFAGRLPAYFMSIVLVAVVIALAQACTRNHHAAMVAGLLAALSPLRIVFAPTAFTDMPMLLFATLALLMAVRGRWGWSGVWLMLSIAAKPQSIFYLPLLVMMWIIAKPSSPRLSFPSGRKGSYTSWQIPLPSVEGFRVRAISILIFFLPIIMGMLILYLWDMARVDMGGTSFWALGRAYYTPTTITPLAAYPARITALWATVQYLFGHGLITVALLIVAFVQVARQRNTLMVLFTLWLIGFLGLHIVLTLNLFDRNLLLIMPIACVLVAQGCSFIVIADCRDWACPVLFAEDTPRRVPTTILLLILAVFATLAAMGTYKIGGDDGSHDGIDALAEYLNDKPVATVIYDRWLDWELDYYMGEWTNKRRVYYPTPQALMAGALALDETGVRYFVAPTNEDISDWLAALSSVGFTHSLDYETANFRVYALSVPD